MLAPKLDTGDFARSNDFGRSKRGQSDRSRRYDPHILRFISVIP